jgi:hypothetical protein
MTAGRGWRVGWCVVCGEGALVCHGWDAVRVRMKSCIDLEVVKNAFARILKA